VPTALGGDGGDLCEYMAALEGLTLGSGDSGFAVSVGAHGALIQLLVRYGATEQQEEFLPGLMSGQIGAIAVTEPTGGSHVTGMRTTAEPSGSGEYRLNGQKCHVTNAPIEDVAMIAGRVAGVGKRDITLFLLRREQDDILLGEHEDLLGLRSSPLGPITMDNVLIDRRHILGSFIPRRKP
jgi:isovaleryl-CoA dehydrogenase